MWTMTLNYCREMVVNKGITDVTRFQQEVSKCVANPVTYPSAYNVASLLALDDLAALYRRAPAQRRGPAIAHLKTTKASASTITSSVHKNTHMSA